MKHKSPEFHYCEQRSDEWYALRIGRVTASNFSTAKSKPGSSGRKTLMMKLLTERITGIPRENYSARWMEEGSELEPFAREYYENSRGVKVEKVGFVEIGDIGASPDGLIEDDGGLEIKCPFPSTHISWYLSNVLPPEHKAQVQGNMWVCDRNWWDFVSYSPLVKHRPMWVFREKRDELYINEMIIKINQFIKELKELEVKALQPF